MSIDGLITVYRRDTGEKVRIPPHWLDNPDLAEPFQRTPSSRARTAATSTPTDADTPATDGGDVPDLDTSTTPTTRTAARGRASTTVQSDTETPAAGAKE